MADNESTVDMQQIETTIQKLGLAETLNELIGQNNEEWLQDFMYGIKCGIAAQKMLR